MVSLTPLLSEFVSLAKEMGSQDIMLRGEKNLLSCKDFNQNEIIDFLDNRREISRFFDDSFSGLQVSFSPENDGFVIHNSSIITAPFKKGSHTAGALGLIGPMRINYAKYIPYLEYFSERITDLLSQQEDEIEEDNNGN
jgi:heat-inducible transcriptional repressor